jgi:hypothetical protein
MGAGSSNLSEAEEEKSSSTSPIISNDSESQNYNSWWWWPSFLSFSPSLLSPATETTTKGSSAVIVSKKNEGGSGTRQSDWIPSLILSLDEEAEVEVGVGEEEEEAENSVNTLSMRGRLYLGSRPGKLELEMMKSLGITHILDVTANTPPAFARILRREFVYKNIRLFDSHDQKIVQHFPETYTYIEECIRSGRNILVHCEAGISRSATIVLAYLIKSRKMNLTNAFRFVRQRRTIIQPNFGFVNQLLVYEEEVLGKKSEDFMAEYLLTIFPTLVEQGVEKDELHQALLQQPNWTEALRVVLLSKANSIQ